MITGEITGVDELKKNLARLSAAQLRAAIAGLKLGGLYVQRESQKIVPVDTSNLKNSAFTRATGSGAKTQVHVGYTAEYAIYVHERTELRHKPGKQAKFIEDVIRDETHRKRIVEFVTTAIEGVT